VLQILWEPGGAPFPPCVLFISFVISFHRALKDLDLLGAIMKVEDLLDLSIDQDAHLARFLLRLEEERQLNLVEASIHNLDLLRAVNGWHELATPIEVALGPDVVLLACIDASCRHGHIVDIDAGLWSPDPLKVKLKEPSRHTIISA
jgi:hypothetical protein